MDIIIQIWNEPSTRGMLIVPIVGIIIFLICALIINKKPKFVCDLCDYIGNNLLQIEIVCVILLLISFFMSNFDSDVPSIYIEVLVWIMVLPILLIIFIGEKGFKSKK